jgi:L-2,4-diaminobutyrate transaminase
MDASAGLWCVNVGQGEPRVIGAIEAQLRRLSYFQAFNDAIPGSGHELAAKLLERAPANSRRVFFGVSGSDATDTSVKLTWLYNNLRRKPAKKKIISRRRGYHGITVAAASCTGIAPMHDLFDLPLPGFLYVSAPDAYHFRGTEAELTAYLVGELEATILREGPETVAAFIAEPVMGTGGVLSPPAGYFAGVMDVLSRYDILLIVDETITGMGRLGTWFGSSKFDLEPDFLNIAKGLTSAYFPMSATLVSGRVMTVLDGAAAELGVLNHGFTYSAHPVGSAAALAVMRVIEEDGLLDNATTQGAYLMNELRKALHDEEFVGDVRGEGLMAGVELSAERSTRTPFSYASGAASVVALACRQEGLLVRALPSNNVIAFSPALVVSSSEVDEIVRRFTLGLKRAAPELAKIRRTHEGTVGNVEEN